MTIQHDFANVNGIRLHYAHSGEGKRPLIFLHGFPACWYVWKNELECFGQSMWAIAPDGRGVNRSAKPKELAAYKIDQLAADVIGLADQLGIAEFVLVGHDWGGAVAWKVGQRHPDRVSQMVVVNAPPFDALLWSLAMQSEQREASHYMTRLKAEKAEKRLLANEADYLWQASFVQYMQAGLYNEADKAYYIRSWQIEGALTSFLNWYRANFPDFDKIDAHAYEPRPENQIQTKTLLLWGEHEKAFTWPLLQRIPLYAPNVSVHQISDTNHWLHLDQPQQFYELVCAFLRGA